MKKVLFGLFALSTVALAAETNVYLRAGADLFGDFTVIEIEDAGDANKDENDGFAYEIAVEATREVYPNLEVGVGLAYQNHNSPKSTMLEGVVKSEFPEMTSIPVYLTSKYNFEAVNGFVPYVKADLGYSFNDCDGDWKLSAEESVEISTEMKDGVYFGIGAGFEYDNFTMDLMYKINKGEAEGTIDGETDKDDFDYSRVTLSFGYKFNF